jgi:NTE family protein
MMRRGARLLSAVLSAATLGAPPAAAAPASCASPNAPWDAPAALVLSGGGAKGAWEAGVAAALVEAGLPIALVAGSSAGALNAAMIAAGRADRLEALWRGLERDRIYTLRAPVFLAGLLPGWLTLLALDGAGSLFDPQPLRDLITASVELDRIRESPVRLLVTAADLERREKRTFDNATVTVAALLATAAVPGAFPPVEVDGALLVDGGLTGRAPVSEALEAGVPLGRVLVALSYAPEERGRRPTTLRRALEEAFEMGMVHQIRRDTELARLKHPGVDVHLLVPSAPLRLRPLDFDGDGIARALVLGRADARECLGALRER